ncbi:hypothetical protein [Bradyrhizobium elkanii]|uniref:hypothetical protein n=1 Tax=Bradyrhizobium elkanii TaxID=29448 RepID=UPI00040EDDDE|nr:hypothetical protein [Bradyrhizobium elkanii]
MRGGSVKPSLSYADYLALLRAYTALSEGDSMIARRHLATLEDVAIRDEIDAVIRAAQYDDAMHRLHLFTNPKYPTVDDCKAHVGNPHHFHTAKQGSLL